MEPCGTVDKNQSALILIFRYNHVFFDCFSLRSLILFYWSLNTSNAPRALPTLR